MGREGYGGPYVMGLEIEGASGLRGARGAVFAEKAENKMGRGVTPCFNEVN